MALNKVGNGLFSIGNDLILVDDWTGKEKEYTSFQMGFMIVGLCREGQADFKISGQKQTLRKGDLLILLGGQVFEPLSTSDDFHATYVIMSRRFAQDSVVGLSYMWPYLLYVMKNPVIPITEEERAWVWDCYSLLRKRAHKAPGRYAREVVVALSRAFYFEICSLLDSRVRPDMSKAQSCAYSTFDRFIRLVSQNFRKHRRVEWYSNEMCVSAKHLSNVVKRVSGRPCGQWISAMVMTEIKALLQNTDMSVKEIAEQMNFQDQSFLGKYFKNVEGISPSDFRMAQLS